MEPKNIPKNSVSKRKEDRYENAEKRKSSYSDDSKIIPTHRLSVSGYGIITGIGFFVSFILVYYYLQYIQGKVSDEVDQRIFYLILILFGISTSALIFGMMNTYATLTGKQQNLQLKMTGPGVGVILVVLGGLYLPPNTTESNITIRVFDWKKNPVTDGNVRIYLNEYIRDQSIDKMGQALFTEIPSKILKDKIKIEVSSPGYFTKNYDTLITSSSPLALTLPLKSVVFISGRIKTASEMPIKGVEINVDGTRYFTNSLTDGSYKLRVEEYTLGDEITITTSHKDYEDKTISLKINAPEISNEDIFLNPISH